MLSFERRTWTGCSQCKALADGCAQPGGGEAFLRSDEAASEWGMHGGETISTLSLPTFPCPVSRRLFNFI